jgi:hypothetical protein
MSAINDPSYYSPSVDYSCGNSHLIKCICLQRIWPQWQTGNFQPIRTQEKCANIRAETLGTQTCCKTKFLLPKLAVLETIQNLQLWIWILFADKPFASGLLSWDNSRETLHSTKHFFDHPNHPLYTNLNIGSIFLFFMYSWQWKNCWNTCLTLL